MTNGLVVSHRGERCGVQQFGRRLFQTLQACDKIAWSYAECDGVDAFLDCAATARPDVVVLNHHPATLAWATDLRLTACAASCFALVHEVHSSSLSRRERVPFDFLLCPDPTLLPQIPQILPVPRFIPPPRGAPAWQPEIFTVGSFGFATPGKGFERLCGLVNAQFDRARLRLHIPPHDNDALVPRAQFEALVARCRARITNPGIILDITEHFLDEAALLDFLSENTINAFLYEDSALGISSCTDYALASGRPLAVSGSAMFRNLHGVNPSISVEHRGLRDIAAAGIGPLAHHVAQYAPAAAGAAWCHTILGALALRETCRSVPDGRGFNKILDDRARAGYTQALEDLQRFAPDMLTRKIARANIQQAFALDTVERLIGQYHEPRILAVGSYEDTTVATLRAKGFRLDEVDPNVNQMDLLAFVASPAAISQSYDLVLCVSVLEHVADDQQFMRAIADLLAPGGVAVFTVDFSNAYKATGRKPALDERLYTSADLRDRLMSVLPECGLLDAPTWDEAADDFSYDDCQYSFAAWVFRKFPAPILRYAIPALIAPAAAVAIPPLLDPLIGFGELHQAMYTMIGQETVEGGVRVFVGHGSTLGYLAFGPYRPYSPGMYEVAFLIKVGCAELASQTEIAVLDTVVDGVPQDHRLVCVYGDITPGMFSIVALRFSLAESAARLETRLCLVFPIAMTVVAAVAIAKRGAPRDLHHRELVNETLHASV